VFMLTKRAKNWFLIKDYFYKEIIGWKPLRTLMPPGSLMFPINLSSDFDDFVNKFMMKLDDEAANQKWEKSKSLI